MTDPVDTDALRALGEVIGGHHSWNDEAEAADVLRVVAHEVDQLRADLAKVNVDAGLRIEELRTVIENAPHDARNCWAAFPSTSDAPCTCWKADAL